ncbi:TerD family protein [Butyrivibrio sp. AC2005]|uniref:TerD family protein n=1 Tax=Butyrivibrio sp. AC2005 TaxID=1280672 RepID=UPI0004143D12|nr:TerD family protein [Butyrivibrio sp. AC2005]
MGINLQKGQKIDLTKGGGGLSRIMVGLGWDEAKPAGNGFLSKIIKPVAIDCDASAILCDGNGKYLDLVYYSNKELSDGSIKHHGDNLTGEGEGDDEQIEVNLTKVNPSVGKIVFTVNIYEATSRNQHFGMIQNAYIHLVDMDKNVEICNFNLSENYNGMEGLIVGEIYRRDGEWKFNAIGQPVQDASHVTKLVDMYR